MSSQRKLKNIAKAKLKPKKINNDFKLDEKSNRSDFMDNFVGTRFNGFKRKCELCGHFFTSNHALRKRCLKCCPRS